MTMHPAFDAALSYAARGWRVLPVHGVVDGTCTCGKAKCDSPGKHPHILEWQRSATRDKRVIRSWFTKWPGANVGVATGAESGLVVLDVDPAHGGADSLRDLEAKHGPLPDTPISLTGGGGEHYIFAYPADAAEIRNSAGKLGAGLDVRANGGFIVAPGSVHASGQRYAWDSTRGPDDLALAPMPDWLLESLTGPHRKVSAELPDRIADGARNATLASLAGTMRRRGASPRAIQAALAAENEERCDHPLNNAEVQRIAESVSRYRPTDVRENLEAIVSASANGLTPSSEAPETPLRLPTEVWRPTFDDYRRALEGVTEAADEHHYAALATAIGAVLGRRVKVDYAYPLYPNMYTLSVGPAGSSKKTTALRLAREVAIRADEGLATQSSVGSGEGLLEALAEADGAPGPTPMHRRLLLTQSEMGQLLAKARQDGSGTLMPLLMDVFDCPPVLNPRTRTMPITAYKPTLSIMAATTPSHLSRYVQDADWYGGLGSRLFICIAEPKDPIPRPRKVDPSRFNSVIRDIHNAVEHWPQETEFNLTDEAARRWDAWYILNKERERELGEAADVVSRTAPYALKLGLIYATLENSSPVIEDGQIEAGILAAEFAQGCALLLLEEIGDSKTIKLEARIIRKLKREPGISKRDLQRGVCGRNVGSAIFKRTLDAMLDTQKVAMRPDGGLLVG